MDHFHEEGKALYVAEYAVASAVHSFTIVNSVKEMPRVAKARRV